MIIFGRKNINQKKVDEIVTNTSSLKKIYGWIESFEKIKKIKSQEINKEDKKNKKIAEKSCLLIIGGHGVGKTMSVELILKDLNYEIKTLDPDVLKNSKQNPKDVLLKMVVSYNILNMIDGGSNKKIAILVDEIESITSPTEKKFITSLQKINDIYWYCPIIFISNGQHNKLLSEIKKISFDIKFFTPFPSDMIKILIKIAKNEGIKIKSSDIATKIIEHSQGDIRRLVLTLQELKYAFKNTVITQELMEEYCKTSKIKDVDNDLYEATEKLLYNYDNIDDCLRLFETEKVILPLMVHQHYTKSIIANFNDDNEKHNIVKTISESLSIGDVIENYIYGDQNWNLQEIHGFYTCVQTSFNLSFNRKKEPVKIKLKFANDLNKTSIKKINKKNIKNTDRCFDNMNIFDYIYINKIVRKLISKGCIRQCVDLLKDYNIKLEHIESLLKIDKIKNTKTNLSSKQKNEFLRYINE